MESLVVYSELEFKMEHIIWDGRELTVKSQPETLNGATWKLVVYPRGNHQVRDEWLSVFLEKSAVRIGIIF
jgi:hypothetical protein